MITAALRQKFDEREPDDWFAVARDLVCEQTLRLTEEGVEHLHFYTLDRHELPTAICGTIVSDV